MNTNPQLIADMPDELMDSTKKRIDRANDAAQLYGLDAARKVLSQHDDGTVDMTALLAELRAEAEEKAAKGTRKAMATIPT